MYTSRMNLSGTAAEQGPTILAVSLQVTRRESLVPFLPCVGELHMKAEWVQEECGFGRGFGSIALLYQHESKTLSHCA